MRWLKPFVFTVTMAAVWLVASSDVAPDRYDGYRPYFMERKELERSVFYADGARDMVNPGKIWVDGSVIFIVERYKGVHIIDNSNPGSPVQTGFIVAPGCMDVATKGGIIYLDNAVDLVAFDLSSGVVTERLKNYFPEPASPNGQRWYNYLPDKIVVGWKNGNTDNVSNR